MEQVPEELGYTQAATASSHSPELTKAPGKAAREARAAQRCAELHVLLFFHAATQPG